MTNIKRNIISWQYWFISKILNHELDIRLWKRWMNRQEKLIDEPQKLVEQIQLNHTVKYLALKIVSFIFVAYMILVSIFSQETAVINTATILILCILLCALRLSMHKGDYSYVYKFAEEYEKLIYRLNLSENQKDFSFETLQNRAESFLIVRAEAVKQAEKIHGNLSEEAETQRRLFKENYAFYKSFGLAENYYDFYFNNASVS